MKATASLLDILNFVVAYQRLFGEGNPSTEQIAPAQHAHADCIPSYGVVSNHTCVPSLLRQPTPHPAPPLDRRLEESNADDDDRGLVHLQVGSLVEIYGDKSAFASPAVITGKLTGQTRHGGLEKNPSSTKYNLRQLVNDFDASGVDPEFIRPYSVYEDGTKASCNVSKFRNKAWMSPCTILGNSSIGNNGGVLYQAQYVDHVSKREVQKYLPFDRVQRVHATSAATREATLSIERAS